MSYEQDITLCNVRFDNLIVTLVLTDSPLDTHTYTEKYTENYGEICETQINIKYGIF